VCPNASRTKAISGVAFRWEIRVLLVEKGKRLSLRIPLVVGGTGFAACALAFLGIGLHIFWNSPRLINFLAAWIPFILSILFAFVPSGKEMKHQWIKWTWRGGVVVVGFFWSVMLWHQQDLSDQANAAQTKGALGSAVSQADDHADKQFKRVQDQVSDVKNDLKTTEDDITTRLDQSTSSINAGLGKVGKPDPPELAKLVFSLWKEPLKVADFPILSTPIQQQDDQTIQADYYFRNVSNASADTIDVWIHICSICSFAKEPEGFDKPVGIDEQTRHRQFGFLNGGVAFQKSTVLFKLNSQMPPTGMTVGLSFSYSCKTCGGVKSTNDLKLQIIPSVAVFRQLRLPTSYVPKLMPQ
jgi:hypothetical protein